LVLRFLHWFAWVLVELRRLRSPWFCPFQIFLDLVGQQGWWSGLLWLLAFAFSRLVRCSVSLYYFTVKVCLPDESPVTLFPLAELIAAARSMWWVLPGIAMRVGGLVKPAGRGVGVTGSTFWGASSSDSISVGCWSWLLVSVLG